MGIPASLRQPKKQPRPTSPGRDFTHYYTIKRSGHYTSGGIVFYGVLAAEVPSQGLDGPFRLPLPARRREKPGAQGVGGEVKRQPGRRLQDVMLMVVYDTMNIMEDRENSQVRLEVRNPLNPGRRGRRASQYEPGLLP